MARGDRYTVVMQVWDVTADIAYLALTESFGIYRSMTAADRDAATAQAQADHMAATQPTEGRQQIRIDFIAAPCFYPDTDLVLDGLRRAYGLAEE